MIGTSFRKYKALSLEVKSILGSFWVYSLAELVMKVFMGIFVYTTTESMALMAVYFFVYFTACMLGFSGWGWLMAQKGIDMKWNHLRAFAFYIAGFVWFWFFRDQFWHFLVFAVLHGAALGLFWLGHHSFEMLHTNDKERDFYSSMLGVGSHVAGILGPLIATLSFLLSDSLFGNDLTLIFFVLPAIYLLVIPFLWNLPRYTPQPISMEKAKTLLKSRGTAQKFAFVESLGWGAWEVIAPLMIVTALETYVNVGVFDTLLGLFAIAMVMIQGHHQNEGNRLRIYYISVAFIILYFIGLYFWPISPWIYILLGFYWVPVQAVYGTIFHVISLKNIDQFRCIQGDFYAGLLYREVLIWLGRLVSLASVGVVAVLLQNELITTYVGITWIIGQYLLLANYVRGVVKS